MRAAFLTEYGEPDVVGVGDQPDPLVATLDLLRSGGRVASVVDADTVKSLGGRYVFVRPDADMLSRLVGLVASGDLAVDIAQTYPLDRSAEALAASKEGHARGKIVITIP